MDRIRSGCNFSRLTYIYGGDARRLSEMFHLFVVGMYRLASRLLDRDNIKG